MSVCFCQNKNRKSRKSTFRHSSADKELMPLNQRKHTHTHTLCVCPLMEWRLPVRWDAAVSAAVSLLLGHSRSQISLSVTQDTEELLAGGWSGVPDQSELLCAVNYWCRYECTSESTLQPQEVRNVSGSCSEMIQSWFKIVVSNNVCTGLLDNFLHNWFWFHQTNSVSFSARL